MLRHVTLAFLLSFTLPALAPASAQPFDIDETASGGGPSADTGEGIALADDGSRYVVGTFEGTATFGSVSVTSAGDSDIFLVKYDADGNAVWARRAGTDVFNDFGESVAVGPDGSVYATGFFTGIATWDGGANPNIELTTFSDFDAFVAKYTPEGDLEWVRQAGGTGQDTGRDLAVDANGNAYLVGGFEGVGTFGGVTLTSAGSSDPFLVKYDPDGDVIWARRGGSDQGDLAYGVAVTNDGAAHVSGSFRGVAQFGPLPIQSAGATDVFVVQFDTDGEPVWLEGIGADGSEFTRGGGIGLDADGNVYVTGSFSNTILVASDVLESTGFTDVFVAKLSADGDELWGRRGGGDGTNFSAALAVDASGNVLTTGYVDGTGTFADEPITTQGRDGYLAVLNNEGNLITVELLGGTGQDAGTGVAANEALARFAATGSFRGTATFGDLDLTSAGSSDTYVIGGPTAGDPVPSTLFVDADATGGETGLSWADAFTDLQDALAAAAEFDADSLSIWVAEGTYYPTDDGDRSVSFELVDGVALYGGFDGTETSLDQRDPEANETVLSGDVGVPGSSSDNTFHVVAATDVGSTAVLDGFTVTSGRADGTSNSARGGAGLFLIDSSPIVRGCLITGNTAIGNGPSVPSRGGGLLSAGGSPTIESTSIVDNSALEGGGVFLNSGTPTIKGSTITNNSGFFGGGVHIALGTPSLVNVELYGNDAQAEGGGILITSGSLIIANALFAGNISSFGSSAYFAGGNSTVINSTVYGGDLDSFAEGIFVDGGDLDLSNSIVRRIVITDGEVYVANSLIAGGCPSAAECNTVVVADPLFVRNASSGPDGEWGTEDDDYGDLRLQEGSPAVDFGRTEFLPPDTFDLDGDGDTEEPLPIDLDGDPRVQGNAVDLGAYESPFTVALEPGVGVPTVNALGSAYPNPFRDRTTLALDMAEAQDVTVEVFDVLGRRVATVHDGPLDVGQHRVVIEAGGLPAGIYVVYAEGETFKFAQRVTLAR